MEDENGMFISVTMAWPFVIKHLMCSDRGLQLYIYVSYVIAYILLTYNCTSKNIGHVCEMLVSGYSDRRFKPGCVCMLCH